MTRAGIVFAILNLLLAIVYVLLVAPIVAYRLEKRQAIDREEQRIPQLEARIIELEQRRSELPHEIAVELHRIAHETTAGLNARGVLEAKKAVLTDQLNDVQSRRKVIARSIQDVEAEVLARQEEVAALKQTLTTGQEIVSSRERQISDLRQKLAATREAFQQTSESVARKFQRLGGESSSYGPSQNSEATVAGAKGQGETR